MNVHANLQIGTMNMSMIHCHLAQQSNPFQTVPSTIFTLIVENFNQYAADIRRVLRRAPKGRLSSEELREAAELPPGKLLPVTTQMEKDGDIVRTTDYSTQPPGHLYSLTKKGQSKP